MDLRVGMNGSAEDKISCFCRDSNSESSSLSLYRQIVACVLVGAIYSSNQCFSSRLPWSRANNINNCPTRCNTKQYIYYSASSHYTFRVSTTPIIKSTQNCNYSLRYCAATSLQRDEAWPRWREVAAQKIWPVPKAVVTLLCTPDDGCGWRPKHVDLATLDGGSCTKIMTSTGSYSYSFVHSWWWVWLTPETCRLVHVGGT